MAPARMPSGRFLLRLPPALHAQLAHAARAQGLSLNEYCVRSLARTEAAVSDPFGEVVAKVLVQLGPDLVAVAVFGSFARGEARVDSDVDVLIVVSAAVAIGRSLYRPWDGADLRLAGHRVEPHYVQMRSQADPISGFWAEVALDGAVVHDPTFALTRELVRIRRAILSGRLVRRTAGGQSWWTSS